MDSSHKHWHWNKGQVLSVVSHYVNVPVRHCTSDHHVSYPSTVDRDAPPANHGATIFKSIAFYQFPNVIVRH